MGAFTDLTDQTFSRLKVTALTEIMSSTGSRVWVCECECGNIVNVRSDLLRSGGVRSCGCLKVEALKNRATHAASRSTEYASWVAMKARCNNPNSSKYYMYGARGITICPTWVNSFENFIKDMGAKPSKAHTIERLDGSLGYSKENCIWADKETQSNNTRLNRAITYQGETLNLRQWSRRLGIPVPTLINRLDGRGLSVEQAFTVSPFQRAH